MSVSCENAHTARLGAALDRIRLPTYRWKLGCETTSSVFMLWERLPVPPEQAPRLNDIVIAMQGSGRGSLPVSWWGGGARAFYHVPKVNSPSDYQKITD